MSSSWTSFAVKVDGSDVIPGTPLIIPRVFQWGPVKIKYKRFQEYSKIRNMQYFQILDRHFKLSEIKAKDKKNSI